MRSSCPFLIFAALAAVAAAQDSITLYTSKSQFDVAFTTASGLLSTESRLDFETQTSAYIEKILGISQVIDEDLLDTNVVHQAQARVDVGDDTGLTLRSSVAVSYVDDAPMPDLSSVLSTVIRKKQADDLLRILKTEGVLAADASNMRVSFSTDGKSSVTSIDIPVPSSSSAEVQPKSQEKNPLKGVCIFLVICIICMSGVLLWVTGAVRCGDGNNIETKRTMDDEESAGTPRLGAKPSYDEAEESPRASEGRGDQRHSSSSKGLGITSLRKLYRSISSLTFGKY